MQQLRDRRGATTFAVVAAVATALAAALRFVVPHGPPDDGGAIERLYVAYLPPLDNLLSSHDSRHPGLWAALVHAPLVLSGRSMAVVRDLSRLCAIASVPVAGLVVRARAGAFAAALAMIAVALLPVLAVQAQAVSDTTLLVLLGLSTLLAYERFLAAPAPRRAAVFGASLGLALQASYGAVPLAAAIVAHALAGRARRRPALAGVLVAAAIGSTALWRIARDLGVELAAKQSAQALPWRSWSQSTLPEFLTECATSWFGPGWPLVLVALCAVIAAGAPRLRARAPLVVVVAAYAAALLLQPWLRIKPYYAILLPITAVLLAASLVRVPPAPDATLRARVAGTIVPLLGAFACVGAFSSWLGDRWSSMVAPPAPHPSEAPIRAALADGATELLFDWGVDWTHVTYSFFDDPYEAMRARYERVAPASGEFVAEDPRSHRTVRGFSPWALESGWERRSLEKLDAVLAERPAHVLLDRAFPNAPLFARVESTCTKLAEDPPYEAWRCPRTGAARAP